MHKYHLREEYYDFAKMPSGGDERVDEKTNLVVRETVPFEREETPDVQARVWGGNYRLYPAETVASIREQIPAITFARLTAPAGITVLVNAGKVVDRDDRTPVDEDRTNSVLTFGPGPHGAAGPCSGDKSGTCCPLDETWTRSGAC